MITCPNINLPEWKRLVSAVGENKAYYLWAKYDGYVPENEYRIAKLNPKLFTDPSYALEYFKSRLISFGYNANTGYTKVDFGYFEANKQEHVLEFFKGYGFTLVRGANNILGLKKGNQMFTQGNFPSNTWERLFNNTLPFAHIGAIPKLSPKAATKLRSDLENFMAANEIRVESLEETINVLKKQGRIQGNIAGIGGIADAVNKVIGVAEGKDNVGVLAEEVGHIAISMLGLDHRLVKPALDRLPGWDKYNEYYQEYFPVYKESLNMTDAQAEYHTQVEILGKLLTEEIIKKSSPKINDRLKRNLEYIWNKILSLFSTNRAKSLQEEIEDTMGVLASKIVAGETFSDNTSSNPNSIFFNIDNPKLDRLAKDVQSELGNRIRNLEKRARSFSNPEETYKNLAKLKERKEELENSLENKQMAAGIWKHMQKLDEEVQDMYENLSDVNSAILSDSNRIFNLIDFVDNNRGLVEEIGKYLEDILTTDPKALEDTTKEDLRAVIKNARNSLIDLEAIGEKFYKSYLDRKLQEENPTEYTPGDLEKSYNRDLGLLSWAQAFTGSLKNASNIVLRTAFKIMNEVHNEVNHNSQRLRNELISSWQDAEAAGFKPTDFMEKIDGQLTGRLLSRFNHAKIDKVYEEAKNTLVNEFKKVDETVQSYDDVVLLQNEISKKEKKERSKEEATADRVFRKVWADTNNRIYTLEGIDSISTEEISSTILERSFLGYRFQVPIKYLNGVNESKELSLNQIVSLRDKEGNSTRNFGKVTEIVDGVATITIVDGTDIGIRKEFLTDEQEYQRVTSHPFYLKYLTEFRKEKAKLPPKYQIGRHKWMLPQIMATKEDLIKEGRFQELPERFKQGLTHNPEDDVYGSKFKGINGKIQKYLPIYFTAPVDPRLLSHDIVGSLVKFSAMTENFKQLSQKKGDLLLLQKQLGESLFEIKGKDDKSGKATATYKMLEQFLDMHLWGEKEDKLEVKVGKNVIAGDKLLKSLYTWIESSNLAFSIPIAVSGAIKSNIDQWTERALGEVIGFDSSKFSTLETARNIPGVLRDMGSRIKTNKVSALLEYTGLSFEGSKDQLNIKNKALRVIGKDIIYSPYVITETDRKMRLLISIMDNLRTIDGVTYTKTEFLAVNKDNPKAAEIWENNKENSLYNKASLDNGTITGISKEDLFRVRNHVNDLGPRLEGRVSPLERGSAFKNPWARFLMMHRSWLVSGIENRLKGQSTNSLTGIKQEGTYKTSARLAGYLVSNVRNLQQAKAYWAELEPFERRNFLQTGVDMAWMMALTLVVAALNGLSDDEDERENWLLQYSAYQASRVLLEQQAFWNPMELAQVVKSPAAGINTVEDLTALFGELFFKWDPIESGPYEGQYPAQRFLWKRLWFKNLYELQYPRTKNQWLRSQVLKTGFNTFFYEPIEEGFSNLEGTAE